ncbi:hypothetical protein K0M31_013465 [Melipona bicolor]|uniref:Uncharacterized protein n=1 Tax=Melipona bicolor TaxID=60889 RepID=A0AA40FIP6_9HYME|nr:hypothetical protein K0M31_013465 [Melipona bicolor]
MGNAGIPWRKRVIDDGSKIGQYGSQVGNRSGSRWSWRTLENDATADTKLHSMVL